MTILDEAAGEGEEDYLESTKESENYTPATEWKLKEYRHKMGTAENPFCKCGEVENVEQYLLLCQEYECAREKTKQELFLRYGIKHLSVEQFLEEKEEEEETKYTQQEIFTILDNHIDSTKRFQI